MSITALVVAFFLVMLIGLLMLVGLGGTWRRLFNGGAALEALIDRRYLGK